MKKLLKRISVVLFASFIALSCASCKDDGDSSSSSGGDTPIVQSNGNHIFNAKDTNKYVVKNGQTDYKLVYPSGTVANEIATAVDEFIYLFQKATGVKIKKITDQGLTHTEDGKYISIGKTSLFESSGLTLDEEKLGLEGSRILTKDNTVYIVGNTDRGTLYGMYTYFQYNFNFDNYNDRVFEIDEVSEFKLKEYEITDIPDFPERTYHHKYVHAPPVFDDYDRNQFRYRMRFESDHYRYIPIYVAYDTKHGSHSGENAPMSVLPYGQFKKEHPKWYSDRSTGADSGRYAQLCYTAHGDEAEYQLMLEEAFEKIKWCIKNRPKTGRFKYASTVLVDIADNNNSCTCLSCAEMTQTYMNAEIASQIPFTNDLSKMISDWQQELLDNKDNPNYAAESAADSKYGYTYDYASSYIEGLNFEFSAYGWCSKAPAAQDADGNWFPAKYNEEGDPIYAPEMELHENVTVKFAYINTSSQMSLYNEENPAFLNQVNAWNSLGPKGFFYFLYDLNYANVAYFYDSFNFYSSDCYRFLRDAGTVGMIMDGNNGTLAAPGYFNLKAYIDSKMFWDASQDVPTLVDKYFKAVYKDAAPQMKQAFTLTRVHTMSFIERAGLNVHGKTCQVPIEKKDNFPLPVLNALIKEYDKAFAVAEKYKYSDPELYEEICLYIELEALSPLVSKGRLYYNELKADEKAALRDRLLNDLTLLEAQDLKLDEFGTIKYGEWVKTL